MSSSSPVSMCAENRVGPEKMLSALAHRVSVIENKSRSKTAGTGEATVVLPTCWKRMGWFR